MDVSPSLCYGYSVREDCAFPSILNKVNFTMTSFDLHSEQDRFNEECAVFGVYGSSEAHVLTALGLHALQHLSLIHI